MGRAILYLMQQNLADYRDLILNSCLHNRAYDSQINDNHAGYIYPILKNSGEEDWYLEKILAALATADDSKDIEQMLDLAVLFARAGNHCARQAVYDTFYRYDAGNDDTGATQIIEMDGINGFLHVAETIGAHTPDQIHSNCRQYSLSEAEDRCGIEPVHKALKMAVKSSPQIAAFVTNLNEPYSLDWSKEELMYYRKKPYAWMLNNYPDLETVTWEELKDKGDFRQYVTRWACKAPEAEIMKAAVDFPSEIDAEGLKSHLRIFWKREFPLAPAVLIELLDHKDDQIVVGAFNALENIHHPAVRDTYFRFRSNQKRSARAIGITHV